MRQIFGLLFLLSIAACGESAQTNKSTVATAVKATDTTKQVGSAAARVILLIVGMDVRAIGNISL
jgi:hypothetical protein